MLSREMFDLWAQIWTRSKDGERSSRRLKLCYVYHDQMTQYTRIITSFDRDIGFIEIEGTMSCGIRQADGKRIHPDICFKTREYKGFERFCYTKKVPTLQDVCFKEIYQNDLDVTCLPVTLQKEYDKNTLPYLIKTAGLCGFTIYSFDHYQCSLGALNGYLYRYWKKSFS